MAKFIVAAINADAQILEWARWSIRFNDTRERQARDLLDKLNFNHRVIAGATVRNVARALAAIEHADKAAHTLTAQQFDQLGKSYKIAVCMNSRNWLALSKTREKVDPNGKLTSYTEDELIELAQTHFNNGGTLDALDAPKLFEAVWGNDFFKPGKKLKDEGFFSKDVCYDGDDITAIRALNVGETWRSPDGTNHTVTRVR